MERQTEARGGESLPPGPLTASTNSEGVSGRGREAATYSTVAIEKSIQDIESMSNSLFGKSINVAVTDFREGPTAHTRHISSSESLQKCLHEPLPRLRLVSLFKPTSLAPFEITKDDLLMILKRHSIHEMFFELLLSFRCDGQSADYYGSQDVMFNGSKQLTLSYELQYIERVERPHGTFWSRRRIGVFHNSGTADKHDVMIILHTGRRSQAAQKICSATISSPGEQVGSHMVHRPFEIHSMIISCYLRNWRWYLDDMAAKCTEFESSGFTAPVSEHVLYDDDPALTFKRLQELRWLESEMAITVTTLQATVETLLHMKETMELEMELRATEVRPTISLSSSPPTPPPDGQGFQVSSELDKTANANFIRAAKSHLNSARLIQARTEKLAQISVDGLNQKCHLTAADINRSLLHLGKKSLDDNVTVRTVTVITLIFLPTQLIAALFGTNFVRFNDDEGNIQVSTDVWIFFALATPLTLATLGIWLYSIRKRTGKSFYPASLPEKLETTA